MALSYWFINKRIVKMVAFTILTSVIMQAQIVNSFYIPGVAPTEYKAKEKLEIRVSDEHLIAYCTICYSY